MGRYLKAIAILIILAGSARGAATPTPGFEYQLTANTLEATGKGALTPVSTPPAFQTVDGKGCATNFETGGYALPADFITYVNANPLSSFTYSFELDIKPSLSPIQFPYIISWTNLADTQEQSAYVNTASMTDYSVDLAGGVTSTYSATLAQSSWHTWWMDHTLNRTQMFLDGAQVDTSTGSTAAITAVQAFIGTQTDGTIDNSSAFSIRNVRFWAVAMTPGPTDTPTPVTTPTPQTARAISIPNSVKLLLAR